MEFSISHNETELFRQVAAGNEKAYATVFHLYTPRLFPYILKIAKDEQLARELLQETFLRVWLKRADLVAVQHPGAWLFRIAANLCLSHLRVQAGRNQLQHKVFEKMKPGEYPVVEQLEGREMEWMIHKAVEALPAKRKEVYLLSRNEGLSHQEIAERLGISMNTVKNHLGLALKTIQEYLHDQTGLSMAILFVILTV